MRSKHKRPVRRVVKVDLCNATSPRLMVIARQLDPSNQVRLPDAEIVKRLRRLGMCLGWDPALVRQALSRAKGHGAGEGAGEGAGQPEGQDTQPAAGAGASTRGRARLRTSPAQGRNAKCTDVRSALRELRLVSQAHRLRHIEQGSVQAERARAQEEPREDSEGREAGCSHASLLGRV